MSTGAPYGGDEDCLSTPRAVPSTRRMTYRGCSPARGRSVLSHELHLTHLSGRAVEAISRRRTPPVLIPLLVQVLGLVVTYIAAKDFFQKEDINFGSSNDRRHKPEGAGNDLDLTLVTVAADHDKAGGFLKGYLIKRSESESCPTLIYFHGNSVNVWQECEFLQRLSNVLGVNACAVDVRGFGDSTGDLTGNTFKTDPVQIVATLLRDHEFLGKQPLVVWGHGTGCLSALKVASNTSTRQTIRAVVLANPYLTDFGSFDWSFKTRGGKMPWCRKMALKLYAPFSRRDVEKTLNNVSVPILMLGGGKDPVVPLSKFKELVNARAPNLITRHGLVEHGTHHMMQRAADKGADEILWKKVSQFISSWLDNEEPVSQNAWVHAQPLSDIPHIADGKIEECINRPSRVKELWDKIRAKFNARYSF